MHVTDIKLRAPARSLREGLIGVRPLILALFALLFLFQQTNTAVAQDRCVRVEQMMYKYADEIYAEMPNSGDLPWKIFAPVIDFLDEAPTSLLDEVLPNDPAKIENTFEALKSAWRHDIDIMPIIKSNVPFQKYPSLGKRDFLDSLAELERIGALSDGDRARALLLNFTTKTPQLSQVGFVWEVIALKRLRDLFGDNTKFGNKDQDGAAIDFLLYGVPMQAASTGNVLFQKIFNKALTDIPNAKKQVQNMSRYDYLVPEEAWLEYLERNGIQGVIEQLEVLKRTTGVDVSIKISTLGELIDYKNFPGG